MSTQPDTNAQPPAPSALPTLPPITAPILDPVPRPAWGEEDVPADTLPDTTAQTAAPVDTEAALMFRMRQA